MYRNSRDEYNKIIKSQVEASKKNIPEDLVMITDAFFWSVSSPVNFPLILKIMNIASKFAVAKKPQVEEFEDDDFWYDDEDEDEEDEEDALDEEDVE